MAEPEDLIAEGALLATEYARRLRHRHLARHTTAVPRLADISRRLELFLAACFPEAPEIGPAERPAPPNLLTRLARRGISHLFPADALASSDGDRIRLPSQLDQLPRAEIVGRYRLLALEQAARIHRGTAAVSPNGDRLLRDLYSLSEAAAIDAMLTRMFPPLGPSLRSARLEAAESLARIRWPSATELAVETLLMVLLKAEPGTVPTPFIEAGTSAESLQWAVEQRHTLADMPGRYRGTAPVPLWGAVGLGSETPVSGLPEGSEVLPPSGRTRTLPRRPRAREAAEGEDDSEPGTWIVRADDPQEKAEDPAGLQRPADRDQHADPGALADALSELPEARLVRTPDRVAEILATEDPIPRMAVARPRETAVGFAYPEWDWRTGRHRPDAAMVRPQLADEGSDDWVTTTRRRYAVMIRAVRRDFERLRPRRIARPRQPDGSELDLDALVSAYADRMGGSPPDDRHYIDSPPLRRDAAIALLVDTSASTDGWVTGNQRIIDVEKDALLIVAEALAALGDRHGIFAFASNGPTNVTVRSLRQFDERVTTGVVHRRIAGLEPDGFTRAGAALRHTTALLHREAARHRLLLLLSDGRPNDVDEYEGRYGIEDVRMAVAEAQLLGVHVFCLTVDRQAPRYATRIFGRHFAVLPRPEMLPKTLTALLSELIRS